jgi:hypothetical protein
MLKQVGLASKVQTSGGSSGSEGLGKYGAIAGALGAAAVVGSGGAAAPAVLGAAGSGAALGGLVGGVVDPGKQAESPMQRRLDSTEPQMLHSENSQRLRDSILALHQAPPEVQNQYAPTLLNAYLTSLHQDKVGGIA